MTLLDGLVPFFTSSAALLNVGGVLLGLIIGAIPGLGPVTALALAIPITFGMEPGPAMVFLLAVYVGSVSGGGVSSILLNIPGTPGSIPTTFDGFPLAQQGRAKEALGISMTSSALGAIFGAVAFIVLGPMIGSISPHLGPAEYTLLITLAFLMVAAGSQADGVKGILMGALGLLISFIGRDVSTGTPRYTGGWLLLEDGIPFTAAVIGLFALGQVIAFSGKSQVSTGLGNLSGSASTGVVTTLRNPGVTFRSSILGSFVGILPGVGITVSSLVNFVLQRKIDRRPDVPYGKGNPKSIIASETGNNAAATSSLTTTFGLGIPGGSADAVLLGGLLLYGLRPGASFFSDSSEFFPILSWGLLTAPLLVLASVLVIRYLALVTVVPFHFLLPCVAILSVLGAYATRGQIFDVWVMLAFGVLGYFLTKGGFPLQNLVIGMVLGELLEQNLNRALLISRGSLDIFWDGIVAQSILVVCILATLALFTPVSLLRRFSRRKSDVLPQGTTSED